MGPTTHAYGGTRMGDNPETNVVNRWGFSHEVPNLGVLGASVMGTSGARNPTLTAQALAWRTAEHLAKNWKTIAELKAAGLRRRLIARGAEQPLAAGLAERGQRVLAAGLRLGQQRLERGIAAQRVELPAAATSVGATK